MPDKDIVELTEALDDIEPESIMEFFSFLEKRKHGEEDSPKTYGEEDVQRLQELYEQLSGENSFQKGQFVKWKKGLKNKRLPKENQPAVVIEVLQKSLIDPSPHPGSAYFREPLDIVLGMRGDDGNLITFYYDKRRFEPYDA